MPEDRSAPSFRVPKEVAFRAQDLRLAEAGVRLTATQHATYLMAAAAQGGGQFAAYTQARRALEVSFQGRSILEDTPPSGDEDIQWRVSFQFERKPQEADWEVRLATTRHFLSGLSKDPAWAEVRGLTAAKIINLRTAHRQLCLALKVKGDPALKDAANLLCLLHGKAGGRGDALPPGDPDERAASAAGIKEISDLARMALQQMIDDRVVEPSTLAEVGQNPAAGQGRVRHLPVAVRCRALLHGLDKARVEVKPLPDDAYRLSSDIHGSGQLERFSKALRAAHRGFPSGQILQFEKPANDTDELWSITLRFPRTEKQADQDVRLYDASRTLGRVLKGCERGRIMTVSPDFAREMASTRRVLAEFEKLTGDPALHAVRRMLGRFENALPAQGDSASTPPHTEGLPNPEEFRAAAVRALAALKALLDRGVPENPPLPMPDDEVSQREYLALWRARSACLSALLLRDDRSLDSCPKGVSIDMSNAAVLLERLGTEHENPHLAAAREALAYLASHTPLWRWRMRRVPVEYSAVRTEECLLSAASFMADIMQARFGQEAGADRPLRDHRENGSSAPDPVP